MKISATHDEPLLDITLTDSDSDEEEDDDDDDDDDAEEVGVDSEENLSYDVVCRPFCVIAFWLCFAVQIISDINVFNHQ